MLSDTEYSDFHKSDGDKEWEEYWQDYQDYLNLSASSKEPAQTNIHIVTDEEKLDVEEQEVKVLPSQRPVDIFQLESGVEVDLPTLPPPIQFRDVPTG